MRLSRITAAVSALVASPTGLLAQGGGEGGGGLYDINTGLSVWTLIVFGILALVVLVTAVYTLLQKTEEFSWQYVTNTVLFSFLGVVNLILILSLLVILKMQRLQHLSLILLGKARVLRHIFAAEPVHFDVCDYLIPHLFVGYFLPLIVCLLD